MKMPGIEKSFAFYGAALVNRNWAVSAEIEGAVVLSLWAHKFKKGMIYEDKVSRWSGLGSSLFRKHLQHAVDMELPIRLVIATSSNPPGVDRGEDASQFRNTYAVRPELVGCVDYFDGDEFHIRFVEAKSP